MKLNHGAAAAAWLALGLGTSASAAESGLYLGGNFGRERNGYDVAALDRSVTQSVAAQLAALEITSRSTTRTDQAWWANLGYMRSQHYGFEVSYLDVGKLIHNAAGTITTLTTTEPSTTNAVLRSRGPALALVGRLPLSESWQLEARLGAYQGRSTLATVFTAGANSHAQSRSTTTTSLLAGVGVAYALGTHLSLRVDYLRLNGTGDTVTGGQFDVDVATAGISVSF
jgi:hypothetical protein